MSKRMLVNAAQAGEVRVAIVEDGVLEDLNVAIAGAEQIRGNIYRARVVNVESGLQAAFIDYGAERNGFVTFPDVLPRFYTRKQRGEARPRIQDVLDRGAEMMVQVYKEGVGNKGAAMTTDITLPGRYLVLMPWSGSGGVSRKIEDEDARKKLKDILKKLDTPEEMGVIVRTAGVGASRTELEADYQHLLRVWAHIQHQYAQRGEPGLVYQEQDVVIRSVRDYFTDDIDEVVADDARVHQQIVDFFQRNMPAVLDRVKLYAGKMPIFSNFGLERQLENIVSPKVPLKSGGSIVISPTEALTAIDVNSGKSRGQDTQEAMALQTNMEAAEEVARQLRLRDLGGLIVVDFIDMHDARNRREVEKVLKRTMKLDKARVEIGRVSRFGLLELSRQRIKQRLLSSTHRVCPMCEGSGYVLGTETAGMSMLRRIQELAVSAPAGSTLRGKLPVDVALFLLNKQREALAALEAQGKVVIEIVPDPTAVSTRDAIEVLKPGQSERSPEERRDRPERHGRDRRDRKGPPARPSTRAVPPPTKTPPPTTHVVDFDDDDEEDELPYEPARVVGYQAPETFATQTLDEPASDDEEDSAEESAEGPRAESSSTDENGDKKRRRRRRRKGRGERDGTTEGPASRSLLETISEDEEDEDESGADDEADEESTDGVAAEGAEASSEERGRKRRRRRRKGRGDGDRSDAAPTEALRPLPVAAAAEARTVVEAPDRDLRAEARERIRQRREGLTRDERHDAVVDASDAVSAPVAPARAPGELAARLRDRLKASAPSASTPVASAAQVVAPTAATPAPTGRAPASLKATLKARLKASETAPAAAPRPVEVEAPTPVVAAQASPATRSRLREKLAPRPATTPTAPLPVVVETAPANPARVGSARVSLKDKLKAKVGKVEPETTTVVEVLEVAEVVEAEALPEVQATAAPAATRTSLKDKLKAKIGKVEPEATPVVEAPRPVPTKATAAPAAPATRSALKDKLKAKVGKAEAPSPTPPAPVETAAPAAAAPTSRSSVAEKLRAKAGKGPAAVEPKAATPPAESAPAPDAARGKRGKKAAAAVFATLDE